MVFNQEKIAHILKLNLCITDGGNGSRSKACTTKPQTITKSHKPHAQTKPCMHLHSVHCFIILRLFLSHCLLSLNGEESPAERRWPAAAPMALPPGLGIRPRLHGPLPFGSAGGARLPAGEAQHRALRPGHAALASRLSKQTPVREAGVRRRGVRP